LGVRNIRLLLEYDGTAYEGWQSQPNGRTIQDVLEAALTALVKHPLRVTASGRTDAGVHALGQVANFHTDCRAPLKAFVRGTNALLPPDISVRRADEVSPDFDSRRSARGKTYRYRIFNAPTPSALTRRSNWWICGALDDEAMVRAAALLVGTHDFEAFRSSGCDAPHAVREIRSLEVKRHGPDGELLDIEVTGNGFLRNMVRIIAGTLAEVGRGRRGVDDIAALLASGDRDKAGITAPAQGLTLLRVYYDETPLETYP
jgi:tRNA pseudouridine38-40 synthase